MDESYYINFFKGNEIFATYSLPKEDGKTHIGGCYFGSTLEESCIKALSLLNGKANIIDKIVLKSKIYESERGPKSTALNEEELNSIKEKLSKRLPKLEIIIK